MTKRAVVFCVKGLHIMLVAMAITSLVKKYHSDREMKILVIIEGGNQDDINFIRSIPSLYGKQQISVDFWAPPYPLLDKVSDQFETGTSLPKMDLWRLFLPYYFPDYDQIAYMDNDILITTDINDLFDQMLPEDVIGGVLDYEDVTHPDHDRSKEFYLPSTDQYINAGVFVANSNAYRSVVPFEKMIEIINRHNYPYGDQNILNIAFYNHIYLLPWRFNLQYDNRLLDKYESLAPQRIKGIREQLNEPGIIHFAANGFVLPPWYVFTPTTRWEKMWWETFVDMQKKHLDFIARTTEDTVHEP